VYSQFLTEGFESSVFPVGWIKTSNWMTLNNVSKAHSGSYAAYAQSDVNGNNDWLISPHITVSSGDIFAFYARAWVSSENFDVKVSTTGTSYANFSTIATETVGVVYNRYEYNLDAYAGQQIYLAIRWTRDNWAILIDDVTIGQIAPSINLPVDFSFTQGNPLALNFSQYIQVINPDAATLSVTGNTNVAVVINGFNVTFSSPSWNGTETLTFTVNDGTGKAIATDVVDIIVQPQPVADIGVLSIQNPIDYTFNNMDSYPSGIIKNYGSLDVTDDIQVNCTITDESNAEVYNQTITYTDNLAADGEAEVLFTLPWQPSVEGNFSVKISTIYTGDGNNINDTLSVSTQVVEHFGTGGPDNMGYEWIDNIVSGGPVYDWIEISSTGQSAIMYEPGIPSFSGDDNFSSPIPFGFSFPYYGIMRDSFYVDVNGEILLADNVWYEPYPDDDWYSDGMIFNFTYPVPGFETMPALVAVYWDDLYAEEGTGDVYFQTFGTEPNRYCVVQWNNLRFAAGTSESSTLTFEAIFYENGEILMQYKDAAIGQTGSNALHDNGRGATVGIQNDDIVNGICYLHEIVEDNTYIGVEPLGNLLTDGLAIKFFSGADLFAPYLVLNNEKGNTFDNSIDLQVEITDISEILTDTLYYNTGSGWLGVSHSAIIETEYSYQLPEIENSTTINYYFVATDEFGNRAILPNDVPNNYYTIKILPTNGVDILLAHPGTTPGYQDYNNLEFPKYTQALDAAGVTYDIYNWTEYEQYEIPDNYKTIFLYSNSFDTWHGEDDTLCVEMMNFLLKGTNENPMNIFMVSDNFADACHGQPNASPLAQFERAFIRVSFMPQLTYPYYGGTDGIGGPDIAGYANGSIIGVGGSPIGTDGVEINVFADSPDNLYTGTCPEWFETQVPNPGISSYPSFLFEDGPIDGNAFSNNPTSSPNTCGVWLDNLTYKSFFLSFDISQFTSDADINNMISEALIWFGTNVIQYDISATANPLEGGTIAGNGIYVENTLCTLTATEETNYDFVNWTENNVEVSTEPTYSFTVSGNRNLVANFVLEINVSEIDNNIALNIYPNPNHGTFNIDVKYLKSSSLNIEIINSQGQVVYQSYITNIENFQNNLDISNFSKGIYLLKINNGGLIQTKKIIVQ
jgi:hypothetical protein